MWSSIFWTFFLCFLPSPAYTAPAPYPNALALINDQPDLTIISTLIKRDNVLVDLYTNVRDVTIFAAPDNTFPSQNLDVPPFTDKVFVRAILQQIIAEGVHPTTFTPKPKYYKSALTNPDFVNLSLGAASTRLVKLNGQNNFLAAGGLGANVLESGAVSQTAPLPPLLSLCADIQHLIEHPLHRRPPPQALQRPRRPLLNPSNSCRHPRIHRTELLPPQRLRIRSPRRARQHERRHCVRAHQRGFQRRCQGVFEREAMSLGVDLEVFGGLCCCGRGVLWGSV